MKTRVMAHENEKERLWYVNEADNGSATVWSGVLLVESQGETECG